MHYCEISYQFESIMRRTRRKEFNFDLKASSHHSSLLLPFVQFAIYFVRHRAAILGEIYVS